MEEISNPNIPPKTIIAPTARLTRRLTGYAVSHFPYVVNSR
jgi:hypothetical protein